MQCQFKYERICPLSSHILQKRTRLFKYMVFFKSVFVVFIQSYLSVSMLKYAYKNVFFQPIYKFNTLQVAMFLQWYWTGSMKYFTSYIYKLRYYSIHLNKLMYVINIFLQKRSYLNAISYNGLLLYQSCRIPNTLQLMQFSKKLK